MKQLRLARYLAAGGSPPSRPLEPVSEVKAPKRGRPVAKVGAKTKAATAGKKAREEELAKERRRAGRVARKDMPLPSPRGSEKGRPSPGR